MLNSNGEFRVEIPAWKLSPDFSFHILLAAKNFFLFSGAFAMPIFAL